MTFCLGYVETHASLRIATESVATFGCSAWYWHSIFKKFAMSTFAVNVKRGLQTFAVTSYCLLFVAGPASYILIVYLLLFTNLYWLVFAYFVYMYIERDIPLRGGRPYESIRYWKWWVYVRDYFPIKLVKTADLDPQKNYIICVFPHGIFSVGANMAFSSEALRFRKRFPGIRPSLIILHNDFKLPIIRELMLACGSCSASKESLDYLLSDPQGGRAAVLLVGGAAEALRARPRTYTLVLKERKGFIKIALRNGSPLVPTLSFGENDLYDQWPNPKGSWVRWFQDLFRKVTGASPIIPMGRRIFWLIPKRSPVHIVVGAPIAVDKVLDPSQDQIDTLHSRFIRILTDFFEQEKHNYIEDATNVQLVIE